MNNTNHLDNQKVNVKKVWLKKIYKKIQTQKPMKYLEIRNAISVCLHEQTSR